MTAIASFRGPVETPFVCGVTFVATAAFLVVVVVALAVFFAAAVFAGSAFAGARPLGAVVFVFFPRLLACARCHSKAQGDFACRDVSEAGAVATAVVAVTARGAATAGGTRGATAAEEAATADVTTARDDSICSPMVDSRPTNARLAWVMYS